MTLYVRQTTQFNDLIDRSTPFMVCSVNTGMLGGYQTCRVKVSIDPRLLTTFAQVATRLGIVFRARQSLRNVDVNVSCSERDREVRDDKTGPYGRVENAQYLQLLRCLR